MPPERKRESLINFVEFCSFAEHFEAPTGRIHHKTLLELNPDLLQRETSDVYDYRRLVHYFPNVNEYLPKNGDNAFVIEAPAFPSKVPRYGFFGTYTKFTWHKSQSIRSTVKVYCDGKPAAEKIKFQQPIAVNGSFSFINRSAMCPYVKEYVQEMGHNSANKQISFIIQILDNTAQQTLLTVAVIVRSGPPKKYLFPQSPQNFAEEPTAGISYSPAPQDVPPHQQPSLYIPSLAPLRGSLPIQIQSPQEYDNEPPRTPNVSNTTPLRFSQYEAYQNGPQPRLGAPVFDNNNVGRKFNFM